MTLFGITKRSMKSNPFKTALLMLSLIVAVTTVISLYTISSAMKRDFADKVDEYGTNVVIVPKSENLSLSYAGVTIGGVQYDDKNLHESDIEKLKTIKNNQNLAIIAPKLLGVSEVRGIQVLTVGVVFEDELRIKRWWEIAEGKKPLNDKEVLVGGNAAKRLDLQPGKKLLIEGNEFKVAGVLKRVGTNEDDLVYMDLKKSQLLYDKPGKLSMIEVAAWCTSCPLEQIVKQASGKLPYANVSGVIQAAKARDALISQFIVFSIVLSIVVVTVSVLIVFTSMLSAVKLKEREIGIFRALGYKSSHIFKIILFESAIVGLISGSAGYIIGIFIARSISQGVAGVDLYVPGIDPMTAYISIVVTTAVSLLASLYPAYKASKLSPVIALNSI